MPRRSRHNPQLLIQMPDRRSQIAGLSLRPRPRRKEQRGQPGRAQGLGAKGLQRGSGGHRLSGVRPLGLVCLGMLYQRLSTPRGLDGYWKDFGSMGSLSLAPRLAPELI